MYYLDVVLKLKKKSFSVKQVNSLDNLLLKLENKNEIYDKIVVDLDFITQSELNEFLGNNKIDLLMNKLVNYFVVLLNFASLWQKRTFNSQFIWAFVAKKQIINNRYNNWNTL